MYRRYFVLQRQLTSAASTSRTVTCNMEKIADKVIQCSAYLQLTTSQYVRHLLLLEHETSDNLHGVSQLIEGFLPPTLVTPADLDKALSQLSTHDIRTPVIILCARLPVTTISPGTLTTCLIRNTFSSEFQFPCTPDQICTLSTEFFHSLFPCFTQRWPRMTKPSLPSAVTRLPFTIFESPTCTRILH